MMRSSRESAILIALLFKRSEKTRARISTVTVKNLSKRKHLRTAFTEQLIDELDDLGIVLIELERGGFGLLSSTALNGAPAITAKKYLREDLRKLRKKEVDFDDILSELDPEPDAGEDEDDDY
jgi:hypothetical protein